MLYSYKPHIITLVSMNYLCIQIFLFQILSIIFPSNSLAFDNFAQPADILHRKYNGCQGDKVFLEEMGVEYVFGVPGGAIVVLFDELCKSDPIKVMPDKDRGWGGIYGSGVCQNIWKYGVCIATSDRGYKSSRLSSAKLDGLPVLAITGQTAFSQRGYRLSQEMSEHNIDIIPLLNQVTKRSLLLTDPSLIYRMLNELTHIAFTPRWGLPLAPVVPSISLPIDLSMAETFYPKRIETSGFKKRGSNINKEGMEKALYYF